MLVNKSRDTILSKRLIMCSYFYYCIFSEKISRFYFLRTWSSLAVLECIFQTAPLLTRDVNRQFFNSFPFDIVRKDDGDSKQKPFNRFRNSISSAFTQKIVERSSLFIFLSENCRKFRLCEHFFPELFKKSISINFLKMVHSYCTVQNTVYQHTVHVQQKTKGCNYSFAVFCVSLLFHVWKRFCELNCVC